MSLHLLRLAQTCALCLLLIEWTANATSESPTLRESDVYVNVIDKVSLDVNKEQSHEVTQDLNHLKEGDFSKLHSACSIDCLNDSIQSNRDLASYVEPAFQVRRAKTDELPTVPPGLITDFHLLGLSRVNCMLWLLKVRFTASRNEQPLGKVNEYKMMISSSRGDLLSSYANGNIESKTTLITSEMIVKGSLDPRPPGYIQTVEIHFNRTEASHHYLAIYGVDTSGMKSELSDIITIVSINSTSSIAFTFWRKSVEVFTGVLICIYVSRCFT